MVSRVRRQVREARLRLANGGNLACHRWGTHGLTTLRWSGMDSNVQFRARRATVSWVRPSCGRSTGALVLRAVAGLGETGRVVGRRLRSRHSPPGSGGVTARPRCRRCERIAEPKVRTHSAPAESPDNHRFLSGASSVKGVTPASPTPQTRRRPSSGNMSIDSLCSRLLSRRPKQKKRGAPDDGRRSRGAPRATVTTKIRMQVPTRSRLAGARNS
jgi:hypothetical protein